MFEVFSRARIEEHYDVAHSMKYALFKQIVIPQAICASCPPLV
jgi:hypothetical protein